MMSEGQPADAGEWSRRARAVLAEITGQMPGAEPRPGQQQMVDLVSGAFARGRHLVIEAGTGTGKSLGYLAPAACAQRPVVVSTRTKALQNQLTGHDLGLVAGVVDGFSHAMLKGRANYVCLQKLAEGLDPAAGQFEGFENDTVAELRRVNEWVEGRRIAEVDDVPFPISSTTREQITVGTDECPGWASCPSGRDCHAERARSAAHDVDVIVVNHSLLTFALASDEHGAVLPLGDLLVIDEAHELENAVTQALTVTLSKASLERLARSTARLFTKGSAPRELFGVASRLASALGAVEDPSLPAGLTPRLSKVLGEVRLEATRLCERVEKISAGNPAAQSRSSRLVTRLTSLSGSVTTLLGSDDGWVRYVSGGREPALCAAPVHVGSFLRDRLWPSCTTVLTSATVPTNIVERLSIPVRNVAIENVESPFDFAANSLLFVPRGIPVGGDRSGPVNAQILRLLQAAGGRTLALFTSLAAMRSATEHARAGSGMTVLMQGDDSPAALARQFAQDEHVSLFATRTFFQGIDIPGRTLSLVIIDKLPFPIPTDPVHRARKEAHGPGAFDALDVVMCATDLAQAAGRLIRRTTDRGVVAVLDSRLHTKEYAPAVLGALPPMPLTDDESAAAGFLAAISGASTQ